MRPDGRPSGPGKESVARVFFGLWPDAGQAASLHDFAQRMVRQHGGRAMRPETLHMTLAFLGEQPLERLPEIEAIAASVSVPAFECRFDICGYWAHKQLLWAGCREVTDNLAVLAATLTLKLRQAGFAVERRPFKPHITLVRKMRVDAFRVPPLPIQTWRCRRFVLVKSALSPHGADYRELAGWSLAGDGGIDG